MSELKSFIQISNFAGNRFDLVQAGGGNSSVKTDDGNMYIKASGYLMGDVREEKGYVIVDNKKIKSFISGLEFNKVMQENSDDYTKPVISSATLTEGKASIETFMHSVLNKYTLHSHSIVVNIIASQKNYKEIFQKYFPESLVVEYATPGIKLAKLIQSKITGAIPKIIFLQNHGLIISTDNEEELYNLNEYVCNKLEELLAIDFDNYKQPNKISTVLKKITNKIFSIWTGEKISDEEKKLIDDVPFAPDILVFCGFKPLIIENLDEKTFQKYIDEYGVPKVICYKNYLYYVADSIKKAKESDELFKFNLVVRNFAKDKVENLSKEELYFLSNWDAEKYRQKI